MTLDYQEFLNRKRLAVLPVGFEIPKDAINPALFAFQQDVVRWAAAKGRGAVLLDTGLGKTFVQLEWARLVNERTLIVAPLSVARQTVREENRAIGKLPPATWQMPSTLPTVRVCLIYSRRE